ncbi:MAG TPA: sortase [Candidatus Limnocylindrales bacterium]|nr:sortase [Candidatus Limnocylindrales bacterium]
MALRSLCLTVAALLAAAACAAFGSDPGSPSREPANVTASPSASPTSTASERLPRDTGSPTLSVPRAIPDGYRIQIFRLGIDLPIQEGVIERDIGRQQTPEDAAFHMPGSAIPGERGNAYLYAHARQGMFLTLWEARPGDEVFVSTPDGVALRYVVTEVHPRVPPSDVSWVAPSEDERLTLQTSTGPHSDDPRFVVVALRR